MFTMPEDAMGRGRLQKALDRQYRFDGKVMSLGDYIKTMGPVRKSYSWQEYASKKRDGYYARLKTPKAIYVVWFADDNGIDVPKIVYDALDLPEKKPDHEPDFRPRQDCFRCGGKNSMVWTDRGWRCDGCNYHPQTW